MYQTKGLYCCRTLKGDTSSGDCEESGRETRFAVIAVELGRSQILADYFVQQVLQKRRCCVVRMEVHLLNCYCLLRCDSSSVL